MAENYDLGNQIASLGLWNWFRSKFFAMTDLHRGQKILDVCSGTNAVGIGLLKMQPDLEVYAIDRSEAMLKIGRSRICKQHITIKSINGDAHKLPYPNEFFDIVTLQWSSRHLNVAQVFQEIKRVLKPGGHFYHCDMLRPTNTFIKTVFMSYLRTCLTLTAWLLRSNTAAKNCKPYFVNTLQMFYAANELSQFLRQLGFEAIEHNTVLFGLVGFHKAVKPKLI